MRTRLQSQRRSLLAGDGGARRIACKQAPTSSKSARRRAFTLVELLVAAGITALIAGFIAVIVRNVSGNWSRATGRLGADSQARIALDQLQLDLQGALYRDDGNVWFAANVVDNTGNSTLWDNTNANPARIKPSGATSLQMTAPNLENARFGLAGVWLRFFTTSRGSNASAATLSAPVAVGYQIIRRPVATNTANANVARAYLLHRAEARPAAATVGGTTRPGVLETGYNITAGAYSDVSTSTNTGAITGDPRSVKVPGSNTSSPRNLDSVLADNVIDFGIRAYVRDTASPGGLRLIFPADTSGRLSNASNARLRGTLPPNTPPDQWAGAQPFPEVVDIMIRVLTDEGAALIANLERTVAPAPPVPAKYNNNAQQWWWGVAQENSRVYTRRIVLPAKSP